MGRFALFCFIASLLLKLLKGIAIFEFLSSAFFVVAVLATIVWVGMVLFSLR